MVYSPRQSFSKSIVLTFICAIRIGITINVQAQETPLSVQVDPGSGLTNPSYTLTASGGVGVTNWQVAGLTNGPDLDFGYYDWLQFEMTLPVGYTRTTRWFTRRRNEPITAWSSRRGT